MQEFQNSIHFSKPCNPGYIKEKQFWHFMWLLQQHKLNNNCMRKEWVERYCFFGYVRAAFEKSQVTLENVFQKNNFRRNNFLWNKIISLILQLTQDGNKMKLL